MSNTIQLSSPLDDTSLGVGFDPILCSANHSCDPNAVVVFNQPKLVLRAIKPIKKGEEIQQEESGVFLQELTKPLSQLLDAGYTVTVRTQSSISSRSKPLRATRSSLRHKAKARTSTRSRSLPLPPTSATGSPRTATTTSGKTSFAVLAIYTLSLQKWYQQSQ